MEDINKCFDILELPPDSTLSDVKSNYFRLKSFYSVDSIELSCLQADFSDERRDRVIEEIEESYLKLVSYFENSRSDSDVASKPDAKGLAAIQEFISGVGFFSGPVLKEIRELSGLDIHYMSKVTNIGKQYLEDIEREQYSSFSAEVYMRGYVIEYARCLSIDPARVAEDYLRGYRKWKASGKA
jgi:hypothetical protein